MLRANKLNDRLMPKEASLPLKILEYENKVPNYSFQSDTLAFTVL